MGKVINIADSVFEHDHELGNVVVIKSGSIMMTVSEISPTGMITCEYEDSTRNMAKRIVKPHIIETIEENAQRRHRLDSITPKPRVSSPSIPEPVPPAA